MQRVVCFIGDGLGCTGQIPGAIDRVFDFDIDRVFDFDIDFDIDSLETSSVRNFLVVFFVVAFIGIFSL